MLVSRLLVAAVSDDVAEAAYVFLRRAREVTLRWLREMKTTFSRAATSDKSIEQQNSLCAMASLVRQTYDVDPDRLDSLLSSSEDAAVLLETAITLRESWPTSVTEAPRSLQLLLSRDQQLSHKLEDKLRDLISNDWHILHAALHNVWPGYHPGEDGETWPDSSWILTRTAPSANRLLQDVYYNLLDGVLLVDGKPLGRLPHEIIVHPTYLRTFGQVCVFLCTDICVTEASQYCRGSWMSFRQMLQIWITQLACRLTVIRSRFIHWPCALCADNTYIDAVCATR
jgi:hypothetical protein